MFLKPLDLQIGHWLSGGIALTARGPATNKAATIKTAPTQAHGETTSKDRGCLHMWPRPRDAGTAREELGSSITDVRDDHH
jgi:hypothetical protein